MTDYANQLELQLRANNIDGWIRGGRFHFEWTDKKLAVDVEGLGFYDKNKTDAKYGEAMSIGWSIYRCTQEMVKSGAAIDTIRLLLDMTGAGLHEKT